MNTQTDNHHDHDHLHDHPPVQADDSSPPGYYEVMILSIRDLLIDKGILAAA